MPDFQKRRSTCKTVPFFTNIYSGTDRNLLSVYFFTPLKKYKCIIKYMKSMSNETTLNCLNAINLRQGWSLVKCESCTGISLTQGLHIRLHNIFKWIHFTLSCRFLTRQLCRERIALVDGDTLWTQLEAQVSVMARLLRPSVTGQLLLIGACNTRQWKEI